MSVLLKNGILTDCKRELKGDLLIDKGKISRIETEIPASEIPAECRVIDVSGRVVMPGFVDLHAHFRDPGLTHKEDIETGCRAAVHGGYTFVNLMANTKPVCSDMDTVGYVLEKAENLGICGVHQTVSITRDFGGRSLGHIQNLDNRVKWLSDDGFGVDDTAVIHEAMRLAKEKGIGLMLHEEDSTLSETDTYLAEEMQTFRDVELAVLTGCKTHFCHVSTIKAADYILAWKDRCGNVTFEVTPHHIALNDTDGGKVNPPLRGEEHRQYLIELIKKGKVDAISTDHAPHTPEDKAAGASGFTGLDLSFSTCYTTLVSPGYITLSELSRLMSYNPSKLMGLDGGLLVRGLPADIVVADLNSVFTVTENDIVSKSKNSPMLGKKLIGKIVMTIKGGRVVYEKVD